MQPTDRLHALDAVRAYALLLGVVLHSAVPFLANVEVPAASISRIRGSAC